MLYRSKWLVPVVAIALAALSAGLAQVAQAHILAQPDQPITSSSRVTSRTASPRRPWMPQPGAEP